MNYLVDTNVISELTKPLPNPAVMRWLAESDEDRVFLSVMSLAEIRRGIALMSPGKRRDQLEIWFRIDLPQRFERRLIEVDREIAERWGVLMAEADSAESDSPRWMDFSRRPLRLGISRW